MLVDDVCDGCPQCAELCEPCWARGKDKPVENQEYVELFGSVPMCADCLAGQEEICQETGESVRDQQAQWQRVK